MISLTDYGYLDAAVIEPTPIESNKHKGKPHSHTLLYICTLHCLSPIYPISFIICTSLATAPAQHLHITSYSSMYLLLQTSLLLSVG